MIDDNYDDDDGFVSDFNTGDKGFSMPLDDDEDDNQYAVKA